MLHGFGSSSKSPNTSCSWANMTKADKHLDDLVKVIVQLDSDMLQLNDVEYCVVLQTLVEMLALLGDVSYVPYLVHGADTATSLNVALLTRVDPSVDLKV